MPFNFISNIQRLFFRINSLFFRHRSFSRGTMRTNLMSLVCIHTLYNQKRSFHGKDSSKLPRHFRFILFKRSIRVHLRRCGRKGASCPGLYVNGKSRRGCARACVKVLRDNACSCATAVYGPKRSAAAPNSPHLTSLPLLPPWKERE